MLTNLLTNDVADKYNYEMPISEAALNALIGFLVVFAGISFLILVIWLVGKVMAKGKVQPKQESVETKVAQKVSPTPVEESSLDEETVAVIMAALTAYYEKNNPKCEFTVKRIKRIRRNNYA